MLNVDGWTDGRTYEWMNVRKDRHTNGRKLARLCLPAKADATKNVFCDPSLEPSDSDGSKERPQYMFLLRNKKNLSIILNTPSDMKQVYSRFHILSRSLGWSVGPPQALAQGVFPVQNLNKN